MEAGAGDTRVAREGLAVEVREWRGNRVYAALQGVGGRRTIKAMAVDGHAQRLVTPGGTQMHAYGVAEGAGSQQVIIGEAHRGTERQ